MKPRYVLTGRGAVLSAEARQELCKGIAPRLRQERLRLGLTQDEAAALAAVTREQWGRYERGSVPSAGVLVALLHVGFDVQFILGGQPATEARA